MRHAVQIDGAESAGLVVPEALPAVGADFVCMLAQRSRIERVGARGDRPLRMRRDLVFEIGQVAQRVEVVDRRQGILAAERSEERRVGKEGSARRWTVRLK